MITYIFEHRGYKAEMQFKTGVSKDIVAELFEIWAASITCHFDVELSASLNLSGFYDKCEVAA